ncbi:HD domain-containing protein [Herbivorax sp. ANBcel31]|uniref:hypothetical protein n=1 Tax=Herbivorax sp. ANBcel31 TaxID=3069754 RepID=UPI0027B3DB7C|nr:hypothetical protein [Herbivorax sp. ANBcel31]MDQ2087932.1 HD domain-containing protein [Herbivorax sp. ANBcel31]
MVVDRATNVADNIHGIITISEYEKRIISTTIFNRLHNIHQNSTAYLTFPANRTKRFEHSLGTMFLCSKIFFYSISNAKSETLKEFFNVSRMEIEKVFNNIKSDANYKNKFANRFNRIDNLKDSLSICGGIYNYFMPSNIDQNYKWIYCVIFEAVRISALLHDVGHPPFSHITENAINEVYKHIENDISDNDRIGYFLKVIKPCVDGDAQLHEEIGINVSKNITLAAIKDLNQSMHHDDDKYRNQIFEVLVREITIGILTEKTDFLTDIHNIIDGTLDGDRLDYITRDALNSGLDVGKIEYERLINSMKLHCIKNRFIFCPSIKVLNTLDNYFQRRFDIYKNIIYHHRVVKTDYLLQETIFKLSLEYLYSSENEGTEENGDILPYDISGIWKAIKNQTSELEYSNSLIQWDDSWLITILKKHYFLKYYNLDDILSYKLKELLTNEKSYYSIIKKKEDFGRIDLAVAKVLNEKYNEVEDIIESLKEKSKSLDENDKKMNIDEYFKQLNFIKTKSEKYINEENITEIGGYILPRISSNLFVERVNPFEETTAKAISRIREEYGEYFKDIIIIHRTLKTGIGKPLYLYKNNDDREDEILLYKCVSSVQKTLQYDIDFYQSFYVYVLNQEKKSYNDCIAIYNNFRERIGEVIGEEIINNIKEQLLKFNST